MRRPNFYDKRALSEQNGYHGKTKNEDEYTELICGTSFGLRKNAAVYTVRDLFGTTLYDKLMRHWIRTELGVDIPCIGDVMEKTCWGCGEEKDYLRYCKGKMMNKLYNWWI